MLGGCAPRIFLWFMVHLSNKFGTNRPGSFLFSPANNHKQTHKLNKNTNYGYYKVWWALVGSELMSYSNAENVSCFPGSYSKLFSRKLQALSAGPPGRHL